MSYKGTTATIRAGQGGFVGSDNKDAIPYSSLVVARNIRFDGQAWRKAPGLEYYNQTAVTGAPTCMSGISYIADLGATRQVTAWSTGYVYKESSKVVDAVRLNDTQLAFTGNPVFVQCGQETAGNDRKLLMFAEGCVPQLIVGDAAAGTMVALNSNANATNSNSEATSNTGKISADWNGSYWPSAGLMHDSRVVAWGNRNSPHTLYFSTLDDHTDFLTDLPPVYDIAPGEGEEIRACFSIGTTRLYVGKYPRGIYWIDTSNVSYSYLPVTTVRKDIGIAGPQAITRVGSNGTWFIGADGHVYSLEMLSDPDVDLSDASITGKLYLTKWLKTNVDMTRIKSARILWDSLRQEVWAVYTKKGSASNSICLIFDLQDAQNPKLAIDDRGAYFESVWLSRDALGATQVVLTAGEGGRVYTASAEDRSVGTSAYSGELEIPPTDFSWVNASLASLNKRFDWLEFSLTGTGDYYGYVKVILDGTVVGTYPVRLGFGGAATLGDTRYGLAPAGTTLQPDGLTYKTNMQFGVTKLMRQKIKIGGIGQRFAFNLFNGGVNQDFNVSLARVYFKPLGDYGETGTS